MKVGDTVQYNKIYKPHEVVKILDIQGENALVHFANGERICTKLAGLWPLNEASEEPPFFAAKRNEGQLKMF